MYNVGSNSSIRPHLMPGSDPARPFTVVVADNFHDVEKYKEYEYGKFETLEAAIAACKRIVDEFLIEALRPSMTADELYSEYTSTANTLRLETTRTSLARRSRKFPSQPVPKQRRGVWSYVDPNLHKTLMRMNPTNCRSSIGNRGN
jgi:hypothetical protein